LIVEIPVTEHNLVTRLYRVGESYRNWFMTEREVNGNLEIPLAVELIQGGLLAPNTDGVLL
jgi:hypothetical protein